MRYHLGLGVGHIHTRQQSSAVVHPSIPPQEHDNRAQDEVEVCGDGADEDDRRLGDEYSSDPDDEDWHDEDEGESESESESESEDESDNPSDDEDFLARDEMYG
jgi:hypothetical protein